jgi:hypothetical protein
MRIYAQHTTRYLAVLTVLVGVVSSGAAGDGERKEIGRTTEKELHVVLSAAFGNVSIGKGEPGKIFVAESGKDRTSDVPVQTTYTVRNRVGYLDITLGSTDDTENKKKTSFKFSQLSGGHWYLGFTDGIPISLDIELGVAKGQFDLSGLMVKDFNLSCGASDVVLTFDTPNATTLEEMNIECGVSKFAGQNLGNANFRRFRFEGGVGAATLDFSGAIEKEVDVDIQLGVGACTVIIPKEVGVRVFAEETLVSRIDIDRSIPAEDNNRFVSENFKSAIGRMNVRIDAGLGSVKIRRR